MLGGARCGRRSVVGWPPTPSCCATPPSLTILSRPRFSLRSMALAVVSHRTCRLPGTGRRIRRSRRQPRRGGSCRSGSYCPRPARPRGHRATAGAARSRARSRQRSGCFTQRGHRHGGEPCLHAHAGLVSEQPAATDELRPFPDGNNCPVGPLSAEAPCALRGSRPLAARLRRTGGIGSADRS